MRIRWWHFFVFLLLAVLAGYLIRYEISPSYENTVPDRATAIVQVKLRNLEKHVVFDAISHPAKYISFQPKKKKEKRFKKLTKAIEIPKTLFFYTGDGPLENVWFSNVLPLDDAEMFVGFLNDEKFDIAKNGQYKIFSKKNFYIAVNNESYILAYAEKPLTELSIFNKVFSPEGYLEGTDPKLAALKDNDADIVFLQSDNALLTANFNDGKVEIAGKSNKLSEIFGQPALIAAASEKNIAYFSGKLRGNLPENNWGYFNTVKRKFENFSHLKIDSIAPYLNGEIASVFAAVQQVKDTVVSYDYDDNFNQVETKKIVEREVPVFNLELGKKDTADAIFQYLNRHNAVMVESTDTIFTKIPLFPVKLDEKESAISFFTDKIHINGQPENHKLSAYFNLKNYKTQQIPQLTVPENDFTRTFHYFKLTVSPEDEVKLDLVFNDENRNVLGQLINP